MFFPHNASDQSISVFFNGRMCSVPASDPHFSDLREHLAQTEHDYATVEAMIDKPKMIARLSEGLVDVVGATVYYKGQPVHSTLSYRLLEILNAGENAIIWARFLERVMANPSERSRNCLYDFLNHWKAPITEDGHFIAFKRVRPNYRDIHSGKFDNTPGQLVEMPREGVNPDPDQHCSAGLHVAATSYLGHFATCESNRTVACKVDPADVVAVPGDYGFAKMRVCRYLVLGDAEESFYNNAEDVPVYHAPEEPKDAEAKAFEAVCDECGIRPKMDENLCQTCADEEDRLDAEEWQTIVDEIDEADHIFETGCTSDGVPVGDDYVDPYAHGHNVSRFATDDDEPEEDDEEVSSMAFERAGVTYTARAIKSGIAAHGQRGYSRMTGVPRTTLQDWVTKIEACED